MAATPYPTKEPPPGEPSTAEADPGAPRAETVVRYFEREIDLGPLLNGFPYGSFYPNLETGELFFIETGRSYVLQRLSNLGPSSPRFDLASAQPLTEEDWSKRSLWDIHRPRSGADLWLHADANNDERMNLWALSEKGPLRKVTDYDYVYSFGFDEAGQRIAYLPRHGSKAPYRTCLHVFDTADASDKEIVCDDETLQFTWGELVFSPDGSAVYFTGQLEGDRRRKQLVRVELSGNAVAPQILTDRKTMRTTVDLMRTWVGSRHLLFIADDSGHDNIHRFDAKTRQVTPLTRFGEDVRSAHLTEAGVVVAYGTPAGSTVAWVDPETEAVLAKHALPGTAHVTEGDDRVALVHHEAPDVVFELLRFEPKEGRLERRVMVEVEPELEQELVRCRSQRVEVPTFDKDPETGSARVLHAFLLEPEDPVPDAQRLGLVRAFYGGKNVYDEYDHVLCAAGLTVLSPAVRGSGGFGQSFAALNDRDLGGDEIVDLFHAARWLEKRTGLSSQRIGVYGRSHGAYATLRALTFPPTTEAGEPRYPFGFGIAEAGFSSIETFYEATNIPDWVVRESGDPKVAQDLQRMRDRSPITHVRRLDAPVLLIHGSADWRVPVEESRRFVAAARDLGKPVQYVEVEGQGHHIQGLELQVGAYRARLAFLRAVAESAPPRPESPPAKSAPGASSR